MCWGSTYSTISRCEPGLSLTVVLVEYGICWSWLSTYTCRWPLPVSEAELATVAPLRATSILTGRPAGSRSPEVGLTISSDTFEGRLGLVSCGSTKDRATSPPPTIITTHGIHGFEFSEDRSVQPKTRTAPATSNNSISTPDPGPTACAYAGAGSSHNKKLASSAFLIIGEVPGASRRQGREPDHVRGSNPVRTM